jgi:parallel beta-helix repeat protein
MSTLKRKNANGVWEYIQVTGQDVSQLQSDIDSVTTAMAEITTLAPKPNGTNDTTAIQATINSLPITGGTVLIPDGTYMIDASVGINLKSNMILRIAPNATLKSIPSTLGTYNIVKVYDCKNIIIDGGGSIVGDRDATGRVATSQWGFGISIESSDNITVRNIKTKDCWGDGVYIGVNIINQGTAQSGGTNTITLASGASSLNGDYVGKFVHISGGTGNGQIKSITAYDGTSKVATLDSNWATIPDATTSYKISGGESTNIIIDGVISDNSRRQGMSIVGAKGVNVRSSTFSNTNGMSDASSGLDTEPNAPYVTQDITITDCTFSGNSSYGYLNTGGTQIKLIGCTSKNNILSGYRLNTGHVTISSCKSLNNQEHGVYLNLTTDNLLIGNECYGNTQHGIYVLNGVDDNTIEGNYCNSNGSDGINFYSGKGSTIIGNTCKGNTGYGLNINLLTGGNISVNTCRANGKGGILIYSTKFATIGNNTSRLNNFDGIRLSDVTDSTYGSVLFFYGKEGLHGSNEF